MNNSGPWDVDTYHGKEATAGTASVKREWEQNLPEGDFLDGSMFNEYDEATRVAAMPTVVGTNDLSLFEYLGGDCPSSMNPSLFDAAGNLWRDAGLYEITDDVFQLRGDIAHITFVRGATGWIVLDAGMSHQWTEQAWDFAMKHTREDEMSPSRQWCIRTVTETISLA